MCVGMVKGDLPELPEKTGGEGLEIMEIVFKIGVTIALIGLCIMWFVALLRMWTP